MIKPIPYKMRTVIKAFSLMVITCIISTTVAYANVPDDPTDDGTLGDENSTTVPFDDGVSFLIIAGVAYGAWQIVNAKKKTAYEENVETVSSF